MEIEKIHRAFSDTVLTDKEEVNLWKRKYNKQVKATEATRKMLTELSDRIEQQERFDGLTYSEYQLVERLASLQEEMQEYKALVFKATGLNL